MVVDHLLLCNYHFLKISLTLAEETLIVNFTSTTQNSFLSFLNLHRAALRLGMLCPKNILFVIIPITGSLRPKTLWRQRPYIGAIPAANVLGAFAEEQWRSRRLELTLQFFYGNLILRIQFELWKIYRKVLQQVGNWLLQPVKACLKFFIFLL